MQRCPFCDSAETARLDIEGRRFLVFACMFTPEVDPAASEEAVERHLKTDFGAQGTGYFRRTCDALHLHVSQGEGARRLTAPKARPPE